MNTGKEHKILTTYISVAKSFFAVVTVFIVMFLVIGEIVFPDERDAVRTDCELFETEWMRVLDNGEKVPVETPGKVPAEYGEVVTLTTTLPDNVYNGETICFRTIWQDVTVYIDGELRQEYSTQNSRPFGTNSTTRYTFVELFEEDAGKEMIYQFSSNSKYAGDIRESYIGDRTSIWMHFLAKSGLRTGVSFFLLLLSFLCIIVCTVLKFVYKKTFDLNYLAWTILFSALWMLSEVEFRQLLLKNVSIVSSITYWSLMLIPLTLLLYINDIQKRIYEKVYIVPIGYMMILFVVVTMLQVFDIAQFVEMLIFTHIGIAISIICIIITLMIDTFKKRSSDYMLAGMGVYGMLISAILEIVVYYLNADLSIGTVMAFGLLYLLIMAIIKTGKDLLQSEKNKQQAIIAREAQAKFLANMSHEIRTPINVIIGMNEMILRENDNDEIKEYADNIQSASNMLLGLVNDVLDFSKIESGHLELVEDKYYLKQLIQDEVLLLKARAAGKQISTQVEVSPEIPKELCGDELRIKQILTNLLSNAVKYTKEGSVTLKVFFEWDNEDTIKLGFSVIDTGIGIKEEDLSKLFASFKRLELNKNRSIQGTGLGLNIAKQLVELMNGKIYVESEYGEGSTFTVIIPQKVLDKQPIGNYEKASLEKKKEKPVSVNTFTAPDASILIVDDNPINLSVMKGLLKRTKIQVDLAKSGKESLELTKNQVYDIIFMDHMMPEMDGVEALRLLRMDESNPNKASVVIALTANAIAGCREMYLNYGFNDYFAKPIEADKLDGLLLQYLPKELILMESQVDLELLHIDKKKGMNYCMNSEEFYKEILVEFSKLGNEYISQLDEYFKNHEWKKYAIVAHSIKGNAINIGADNFSKLALKHELAGKEQNEELINAEYENFMKAIKALIEKVEKML